MLKYKNILVPYDGSAHAKKAMAQAADLAAAGEGTKLYIVSVCNMVSAMSNFDQVSIAEGCLTSKLSEDLEAQCRRDLKEAAAMVPEGVAHETVFENSAFVCAAGGASVRTVWRGAVEKRRAAHKRGLGKRLCGR